MTLNSFGAIAAPSETATTENSGGKRSHTNSGGSRLQFNGFLILGRSNACCEKEGLKRGLKRCDESCRLRWINYLRLDIKRGKFSSQKEHTIIQLHAFLGNRWSAIAVPLPKRPDNEIKNHCHMAQWKRARLEAEGRAARDPSNKKPPLPSHVQIQPKNHHPAGTHPLTVRPKCIDVVKAWQGTVSGMFNNFPNRDNLHSPNSSSAPIQAVEYCTATATHHLFTCDELGYIDDWKRFGKLNQMQELEDWMVESTYRTETPWFADNGADFKEGSSESDTLIGIPVSFSSMEVEASNGSHSVWMLE
ncbi:hypothetical protein CXB51_035137 [Gossypium anomalum]|uniref:Uncharacterized protein n=1 Tax=Gossypium anomalum TaxID=47600 RepID=A0A8J5XQP0_9ROSI|nr:hypothetical protein CXB51_035137 [Gossypium anomalum]